MLTKENLKKNPTPHLMYGAAHARRPDLWGGGGFVLLRTRDKEKFVKKGGWGARM